MSVTTDEATTQSPGDKRRSNPPAIPKLMIPEHSLAVDASSHSSNRERSVAQRTSTPRPAAMRASNARPVTAMTFGGISIWSIKPSLVWMTDGRHTAGGSAHRPPPSGSPVMVRRSPRCLSPIGSAPVLSRHTKTLARTRAACNAKRVFGSILHLPRLRINGLRTKSDWRPFDWRLEQRKKQFKIEKRKKAEESRSRELAPP